MYQIKRTDSAVIVTKNNSQKFSASPDSFLVYREGNGHKVSKVGDLTDPELLLALVNAVEIKEGLSV